MAKDTRNKKKQPTRKTPLQFGAVPIVHARVQQFTTPNSLIDAVCWFMCGVACMRIWGYKKPVSMLVHTSQKTENHQTVAESIEIMRFFYFQPKACKV